MIYEEYNEILCDVMATSWYRPTIVSSISVSWVVGGMTGGNCWDGGAKYSVDPEPEPEMTVLNDFLEKVAPNITYLQYRKISELIENEIDDQNPDWYGNYRTTVSKRLDVKVLFDYLKEKGII